MERVDYVDTFIAVADDCPAACGTVPPGAESAAARAYRLIAAAPYRHTSGDVIFAVHAERLGIPEAERAAARAAFYARSQACLRASDLGRRYGWGIHADSDGRIALVGRETADCADFAAGRRRASSGKPVALTRAMARSRAR